MTLPGSTHGSAKLYEIKVGDDVLAVGSVDGHGGVIRGEVSCVVLEADEEAGEPGAAAFSSGANVDALVAHTLCFQSLALLRKLNLKILPRASSAVPVRGSVFHMHNDADSIAAMLIVELGLLGAVTEGVLAREVHSRGVGRKQLNRGNVRARLGSGQMLPVGLKELGHRFVAALAEEIGFADGFTGERELEREGGRTEKQGNDERRNDLMGSAESHE
jgi:hypothetical protein